ncbi:autotransporter-associated beta strand protein [Actinocorallia herbida]|uniref:Autotransporter-associated beta strand protein n=1 Tax=Actinocorallia herbida TaxID=58109 RepID=A0A3N1D6A5_9ACTN|nr:phosphatase PAP2 family protein [Actinocorallia herbida]ROO88996.1 autotransporter-associated beta strand protein [Actinocorallia herbida]
MQTNSINRRALFKRTGAVAAGVAAVHVVPAWAVPAAARAEAAAALPFVDDYRSNVAANLTVETNAAVRILSGMLALWRPGTAWNTGEVLRRGVLRDNMRYSAAVTRHRTAAEAKEAFVLDRQHQSYSAIAGLGPLAAAYKAGALAVTGITGAPDGTPATTVSDAVPAGAPAGSALGAGAPASALGKVVDLVNTVRGSYSSGNPAKAAYQYPRPWRTTEDGVVADTGKTDEFGFPVYASDVVVAPQLLRQRSTNPADDGGYVSGHTNAAYLAALAFAYAVPERFQELVVRAAEVGHSRITAGMHSPVDVVGGRVLATALAAAILGDPANAALKAAARAQAAAYLQAATGTDANTLFAYAHAADRAEDPYADRAANRRALAPRLTYILPKTGRRGAVVPKGAEVLLETRLPYLDAAQIREVLRTTALDGFALLDGPEEWGRLDLFAAADGYGAFDRDVAVVLDAAAGGFHAADAWRNDIGGRGGLTKSGTGVLTLSGDNSYRGGTTVRAGVLVAASRDALGAGDVAVDGGALRVSASGARVRGDLAVRGALELTAGRRNSPLEVSGKVTPARGSVLRVSLDGAKGGTVQVIAGRVTGRFGSVEADGRRVVPVYSARGLSLRLS